MEKIRILFYADAFITDAPDPGLKTWGLSELKKLIEYKTTGLAQFEFDLVLRHRPLKQLDPKFLCKYDEVWIFGALPWEGLPFELFDTEVQALKEWMDQGGGLFITGDHSIPKDGCEEDHKKFLNLGGSLGRRIKRAKELRVWQGPPTVCTDDNANTQDGNVNDLDDPDLDKDDIAQTLVDFPDPPHRLFWRKVEANGKVIPVCKFPDHGHEGALACPDLKGPDWPAGSPEPVVAAKGRDKRPDKPFTYPLVLAYDGDHVNVGRIVADSSFHHYFNVNLGSLARRLPNGYPAPDSDLDQIAQFFGNLALWLAPRRIRDTMKWELLRRIADHPEVFEAQGSDVAYLGKVVRMARDLEADFQNLYRAFAPSEFEVAQVTLDRILNLLILGENGTEKLSVGGLELAYGTILTIYHQLTWGTLPDGGALDERLPSLQQALGRGIRIASEQAPELAEKFAFARATLDELASS